MLHTLFTAFLFLMHSLIYAAIYQKKDNIHSDAYLGIGYLCGAIGAIISYSLDCVQHQKYLTMISAITLLFRLVLNF